MTASDILIALVILYMLGIAWMHWFGPPIEVVPDEVLPTANAQNTIFDVRIREHTVDNWYGVLSQEIAEVQFKWRWLLILPLLITRLHEELELYGHAVESYVAKVLEGMSQEQYDAYRYSEARDLVAPGSSYARKGMFKGQGPDAVYWRLCKKHDAAAAWYDDNERMLKRLMERYGPRT